MPPKRLSLGLVGLGRIGRQHALNTLHKISQTHLLCACSPMDQDHIWAQEHLVPYGVTLYRTFTEMLAHPGLEALLIASTTTAHYEQVMAGIEAGLHIAVEKPLAMNSQQSREILALAKSKAGLKIMTLFSRRFDASYTSARHAIQAGKIGTPVVLRFDNRDKFDRSDFYLRYIMQNPGIFIDTGVHDIDLTFSFLGDDNARPKSATAVGNLSLHRELAQISDFDNAIGTVAWHNGAISHYYISRTSRPGFDNPTEIIGTQGTLKINLHPRRDLIEIGDERGIGNEVMPDFYERYREAFVSEMEVFAGCVLGGTALPYGLEVAVRGMEIAEGLQEALRTGRKVEWDEEGRRMDVGGKSSKL
ncbi:nad-binding rossmann fold oxidoreductase family [Lecanosticta acicola]|uniref:Nad-binding rossmann fold oxidoreductase family n=1 Tax=Lecanosticta acicola TaxID=111012 RepID=A0AAI8Z6N2_9PEZI|nr:nad-binding rossmann fold oxidoreductase family [Lecanosticta acicola]